MNDSRSLANKINNEGNPDYARPWAFATLGGAGGQTVFGALNTGTHGGDHQQPPIADAIVAIHLVADGGNHYWIEPAFLPEFESSLTDEALVRRVYGTDDLGGAENFRFIRDTDVFNAVLVSTGRFGIVYSIVLKVVRQYCMHEQRRLLNWQDLNPHINNLKSELRPSI